MDPELSTSQKISNMERKGIITTTVAGLNSMLAGLPPNMEVFVNADGVAMFLNSTQVERGDEGQRAPFLRLMCSERPAEPEAPEVRTVAELEAAQRQRAMHLAHSLEEATRMPPMVT